MLVGTKGDELDEEDSFGDRRLWEVSGTCCSSEDNRLWEVSEMGVYHVVEARATVYIGT